MHIAYLFIVCFNFWFLLYYCDVLLSQQLLPVMREVSGEFFVFQRDSAPAHRARDTVRLLEQATPAFIPPDLWPANSPDLNPVDYRIWSIVQQRVYQSRVHDTDELKQRLQQVWRNIDQSIIDNAIDEWCKRLCALRAGKRRTLNLSKCCRKQHAYLHSIYDNINVSFLSNRSAFKFFYCNLQ